MYIGRPQDMTYSLLRCEEETPVLKQKELSCEEESFHLKKFVRLANVLLRYLTVKLKIFLGKLLCAEDHRELS